MDDSETYASHDPLTQSNVIGKLRPEFRHQIWEMAKPIKLKKGQSLFLQDDPGDALYAITSGSIEISVIGANGKKLSLNIMQPPEVFGEIGALDGGARTATAMAREPTVVHKIQRSQMLEALIRHPEFSTELIEILCERIRWISQQVEDMALHGLEGRLARLLLILFSKFADDDESIHFSQTELADFLGTTRETINKNLQLCQINGLITISRGKLKIKDYNGLKNLAEKK